MIGHGYELGDNLMINDLDIVQWDYLLSPEFEMINSAGKPLTGGYIEVYIHGTRDKYYCASDFNGTLHPFQIPLDSIGSNVILASPENAYDVYVYNKFGSLIMSRYNVHCQGGNGGPSTYVGDKLFYGQYRASNVTTIANLNRNKGNINLTSNGYLKLKNGMSYHITVRGAFQVDDVTNTDTTLNYIEYTSVNPIKIDIDETKEGPQYFELSYDIYRLPEDMDYQVAFAQSNGMVTELLVEVHSLSNLATSAAGGDQEYEPGWGIDITNNVISVDPSILDDYVTEEELLEIVTGITGLIPEDVATHTEVYEATVTAIEYVTGMIPQSQVQSDWNETDESSPAYIQNKPDLDIYATHDEVATAVSSIDLSNYTTHTEVYDSSVTAIQMATGVIPDSEEVQFEEINLNDYALASAIQDVSDFTTHTEVYESAVTSIQLVTGLIPEDTVTHTEVYEATVTAIEVATAVIPDSEEVQFEEINLADYALTSAIPDVSDFTTHDEVHESIVTAIDYVTGIIPEVQVQSDWAQTDNEQPDYIKNKPTQMELVAGQNIGIFEDDHSITIAASGTDLTSYATHTEVYEATVTAIEIATAAIPDSEEVEFEDIDLSEYALASAIPDVSDFTTHSEVNNAIVTAVNYVTGIIPDAQVQSDWTENYNEDPAYIKNKPTQVELIAGQNIGIFTDEQSITIAASATDLTGYATESDVYESSVTAIQLVTGLIPTDYTTHDDVNSAIVTAIEYVTGIIPDAQVQSNWEETNTSDPSYIQNKPDLSVYMTEEQVMEIVTGVTGLTEYGQFYAPSPVYTHAVMARTKGTIETTQYGDIKLKKGSSYHITVRGRYNQTTPTNVYGNISYVEYITGSNININIDKSITESQYFEVSYDLYKLNSDTDYQVSFTGISNAAVNDLYIEIHAIGSVGVGVSGGAGTEYDAGWGIQILNNVISVNPSILNDYVTENELVTAIQSVVTAIPASQVQSDWTESDTSDPSYIQNKPQEYDVVAGENIGITVNGNTVTISASGGDMSDYATKEELQDSVELVTGLIPDVTDYATHAEVNNVSGAIVNLIPELPEDLNLVAGQNIGIAISDNDIVISASGSQGTEYTAGDHIGIVNDEISVTGITELVAGNAITITTSGVSAIISSTGEAQVQSDWNVTDSSSKAYIKNKPTIPAAQVQSNWNETNTSSKAYIQNKPTIHNYTGASGVTITNDTITLDNPLGLVAGDNITIEVSGVSAIISAQGGGGGTTYTAGTGIDITSDVISVDTTVIATVDMVSAVSGMIGDIETALANL